MVEFALVDQMRRPFEAIVEDQLGRWSVAIAAALNDLRVPTANQLEALKSDRVGQHSIRINTQYRLCFVWTDGGPAQVEIVDYHP